MDQTFGVYHYRLRIFPTDAVHLPVGGADVQRLVRVYVREKRNRKEWTAASVKMPSTALRSLCDSFGQRPISQFGPKAIDRWLESTARLAPSTRRNYVNVVRAFSRWLVQHGHIRRDPCVEMARIKRPRTVVHVVTKDEAAAVWQVCHTDRDRALFALMYVLGLRCIDCSRLDVQDWDRASGVLIVTGKGMHERFMPVTDYIARLLRCHIATEPRTAGPMFPSCKGGRLTAQTISERISLLMYAAGIKTGPRDGKSPHALRRTMATETLMASHDLRATQDLLGHVDLSSMRPYIARAAVSEMAAAVRCRFPEVAV
jgi:site-specific recombinase XerD